MMHGLPGRRIWTHSLGTRATSCCGSIKRPRLSQCVNPRRLDGRRAVDGRIPRQHQKPDGDVLDIFDDNDREVSTKRHRIAARTVVCGLWVRMGQVSGESAWLERARRLAAFVPGNWPL